MRTDNIKRLAHDIIDRCAMECDYIEYKKSADIKAEREKRLTLKPDDISEPIEIAIHLTNARNLSCSRSLPTFISLLNLMRLQHLMI